MSTIPNLFVNTSTAKANAIRLFIRGIGQNEVQITQDPSVALYLDAIEFQQDLTLGNFNARKSWRIQA